MRRAPSHLSLVWSNPAPPARPDASLPHLLASVADSNFSAWMAVAAAMVAFYGLPGRE
jgi:hypothetical protein